MTAPGGWLALSSFILPTLSVAASISARGAQTMPGQRKWSTLSLCAIALDYLIKYTVVGSGAELAGLLTVTIMASRAGTTWRLNFSDKDTRARKTLQLALCWVSFVLCVGITYKAQMAAKGWFDPFTLLALAGIGMASLADSLNVVTWRRRSHFVTAAFLLAFGIYTDASAMMAKTAIDLAACIYFDPLFGQERRARITDALRSMLVPGWPKRAAVEPR
jgi:hypothetical protein